jgi:hypothetical protein
VHVPSHYSVAGNRYSNDPLAYQQNKQPTKRSGSLHARVARSKTVLYYHFLPRTCGIRHPPPTHWGPPVRLGRPAAHPENRRPVHLAHGPRELSDDDDELEWAVVPWQRKSVPASGYSSDPGFRERTFTWRINLTYHSTVLACLSKVGEGWGIVYGEYIGRWGRVQAYRRGQDSAGTNGGRNRVASDWRIGGGGSGMNTRSRHPQIFMMKIKRILMM